MNIRLQALVVLWILPNLIWLYGTDDVGKLAKLALRALILGRKPIK